VSPGVAAENQLLYRSRPPDHPDAGPALPWDTRPPAGTRPPEGGQPSSGHGLLLDHAQRRVWIDGREVQLTFQEFELLAFLAAHPAIVFTRAELVERVWHRALGQDGRPVPRDSRGQRDERHEAAEYLVWHTGL
jgi:DNA-binding response OmpR family regulator